MAELRSVCVFCGSRTGTRSEYVEAARTLGTAIAREGLGLVYGGGDVGLMGVVANATITAGGNVVGVMPRHLVEREIAHPHLAELLVVESMHERKTLMYDLADAFVALPGGLGTLEELAEVTTWSQLGLHTKPVALLDVAGYFEQLIGFLDHAVEQDFVSPVHRSLLLTTTDPEDVLRLLREWVPPPTEDWVPDRAR